MVSTYKYLRTLITNDGKIDLEITNRTGKANRIYYPLNKTILEKKEISRKIKLQVYKSITVPILIYAWTKQESNINTTEIKYMRKIAGKPKMDRVRNGIVRKELKQEPIIKMIENKQLGWSGHICRITEDRLSSTYR